jgi:glycosyltransferase involved in cell wall biosynthesis
MRILHAIHSMSPAAGGPTTVVRDLAQTARRGGDYETEVVCLDAPNEPFLRCEDVPIHGVGPGIGKYGFTLRLDQWLRENLSRFDGVVVNGLWQYHGWASWRACRGRIPYVVYAHGMLDPWFKQAYPMKHFKKALYWEAIEKRLLRDAKAVLFTSPRELELAPKTFRTNEWNGFSVPQGTLGPSGYREISVESFYGACPGVQGMSFLLFIGRIHKKKGCDLLIQAFARSAAGDPAMHLVIAGPDVEGWRSELLLLASQAGIGSQVHFPGMLEGDAKWGAFYAAEAFVLPSHQENFGIAVAESLACGTPVLISNQVNIWKDIVEDRVGFVEDDNLEGTVRLLERWRNLPPEERKAMVARCVPSFQRRYDMRRVPKTIARLFRSAERAELIPSAS